MREAIVVLSGPTASGKSALADSLLTEYPFSLLNGDAFQVYKEIGRITSMPTNLEGSFLYNFLSPDIPFSIADYQCLGRKSLHEIWEQGRIPLVVGGSGLYLRSLLFDYDFQSEHKVDISDLEKLDNAELYRRLREIDPEDAKKIHPNNRVRVLRALTIFRERGINKSEILKLQKQDFLYPTLFLFLDIDHELLKKRIRERTDLIFDENFLNEFKNIYERYPQNSPAFRAIGIKELKEYYEGIISLDQLKDLINIHTNQYVKRQRTFFRHQFPHLITVYDLPEIKEKIDEFFLE